jgi:hypothetical protein
MAYLRANGVMNFLGRWFVPELAAQMQTELFVIIPLPYAIVYKLPILWSLRGVARAGILMNFALCGLAGLGLAELWKRITSLPQGVKWMFQLGLGLLILFEYWQSPYAAANLQVRPIDVWLNSQPRGSVLELPVEQGVRSYGLYARTIHNQPTVFGTSVSYQEFAKRKEIIEQLPALASLQMLCVWDVRYIVVDTARTKAAQLNATQAIIQALPGVSLPTRVGSSELYQLAQCKD